MYRIKYEENVKAGETKLLMIAKSGVYIPYDVQKCFRVFRVSLGKMFPKLNPIVLKTEAGLNYDLLSLAYRKNFSDLSGYESTKLFLKDSVYSKDNVHEYVTILGDELRQAVMTAKTYKDWFTVAELKAELQVMTLQYGTEVNLDEYSIPFVDFILESYGKLSVEINLDAPVFVSRAMDYKVEHSNKFVIIVMDGMSAVE